LRRGFEAKTLYGGEDGIDPKKNVRRLQRKKDILKSLQNTGEVLNHLVQETYDKLIRINKSISRALRLVIRKRGIEPED
jgi:hypothetical protein